ncbi:aldolase/citrate lyase family protein [Sphingomonas jatrophae]|uniref:aldolase/citrate lyase family protein n=1 Tax=Sphingomonas jatrophae TaxID=1166337 RepID=UPI0013F4EB9F|nr:aldolase/citrate lyase family protein [Sphingomonas jatrophae]
MSDYGRFASLKGEFEAEGLSREEIAVEVIFAARRGLDYLVKIGGCEAKSDIDYLRRLGVTSLVAPMIESGFAMSKYRDALPAGHFKHIGVTIETITAVDRIEEILDAGSHLTDVTIGRSDLTASYGGEGVDSPRTIEMVKVVAKAARARGRHVTMGGSVNVKTLHLLREDAELAGLVDYVETRKVIMKSSDFVQDGTLEAAIAAELELLDLRTGPMESALGKATKRATQIRERL